MVWELATAKLRDKLNSLLGGIKLVAELNHYFNANEGGIGFHCDLERKIVIGTRFGNGADGFPLKFAWFHEGYAVGNEGHIELNAGDLYIMSEKAVGFEWSSLRLKHAAGKEKCPNARIKKEHLLPGKVPPILTLPMPWKEWSKEKRFPKRGPMDAFTSQKRKLDAL